MNSFKGRPLLSVEDSPEVVAEALRASISLVNTGEIECRDPWLWRHNAQNSYETIEDAFRKIDGEYIDPSATAIVYMTPDDLEVALVGFGIRPELSEEELGHIDALLTSIDGLKAQLQQH